MAFKLCKNLKIKLKKICLAIKGCKLAFLVPIFLLFISYKVAYFKNSQKVEFKYKIFKDVIDSLAKTSADSEIVFLLVNDFRTHFDERFARLNILGQPKLSFNQLLDQKTIIKIHKFIIDNYDILVSAENEFEVPKEIISTILWIETKFGNILGKNHILSVFFSMGSAGNPIILNNLINSYSSQVSNKDSLSNVALQKAKKKKELAIKELKALVEIQKKGWVDIRELYGSFSGAFGIPQFLPSSFLEYGVDGNYDGKVDLFCLEDAIFSVANYLKKNGWKTNDTNSYIPTLFKYNRSRQYAETIVLAYKELKNMGYKF